MTCFAMQWLWRAGPVVQRTQGSHSAQCDSLPAVAHGQSGVRDLEAAVPEATAGGQALGSCPSAYAGCAVSGICDSAPAAAHSTNTNDK